MTEIAIVGRWAKEKLDALGRYLDFYTKVLKNQRWRTIYVDAFAGGGRAVVRPDTKCAPPGLLLFEAEEVDADQRELIDGSPRVALNVANPFDSYLFIDPDPERGKELDALRQEYQSQRTIAVLGVSAAKGIARLVEHNISPRTHRGIAFLDPFGAQLQWSSLQALANTGLFEVVVNFGLNMTIQRMLPNSGQVPEPWKKTLDAYFGTRDWFENVYCERDGGLFRTGGLQKRPDYSERLLALYRARLKGAFGHVSEPRLIRNTRGTPLYCLLWAGPHRKGLEGANYILMMGERIGVGSRRAGEAS